MAKRKQIVNGKVYDWSSVTIGVSGCKGIEPVGIDYGWEKEKSLIYGKGGKPRGYGTGNQKYDVKLTLMREDYDLLKDSVGAVMNAVIPKITVAYADKGATTSTDTLTNVVFSKASFKAAQGDDSLNVELEGMAVGGITTSK